MQKERESRRMCVGVYKMKKVCMYTFVLINDKQLRGGLKKITCLINLHVKNKIKMQPNNVI